MRAAGFLLSILTTYPSNGRFHSLPPPPALQELQIKLAQGAKPGEGGELPGYKVSEGIARTRKSTPGVGLISPPPHHDIYSIEDLKQLIFDLKSSNPVARVSVKLVSEVGVGIVAAGVAKAKADHILISGHDGGTGASRWTGIQHAGLPWELGLAETHQTLMLNNLRNRVVLQTDGQLKTGRDVAIACLLGAEEWGFATTPLIALGCTMMRKCHLNSCPVGIATQDPELRAKFQGKPEHVINFFHSVAMELRGIMARLGFPTIASMVGRVDCLRVREGPMNAKQRALDLGALLLPSVSLSPTHAFRGPSGRVGLNQGQSVAQDHGLEQRFDAALLPRLQGALVDRTPTVLADLPVTNLHQAIGTLLSYHVSRGWGEDGLPAHTITLQCAGSAGQSFGAFLARGITLTLAGDANDYVGKGLSGGLLALHPPACSSFPAAANVIAGNVCLYGATGGEAYFAGKVAERFAVRNSGATAVVEGLGDHGCEYMTGGCVVVLGPTGRNFGAGMSGGLAYVLDEAADFACKCNLATLDLEPLERGAGTEGEGEDEARLRAILQQHVRWTGSQRAQEVLQHWAARRARWVKVFPKDYKAVLQLRKASTVAPTATDAADKAPTALLVDAISLPTDKEEGEAQDLASAPALAALKLQDASARARLLAEGASSSATLVADIEEAGMTGPGLQLDKVRGFVRYQRVHEPYRSARTRVGDWKEVSGRLDKRTLLHQAARCMECGVPFCQSDSGCPIGNIIPKWNDLVFRGRWREAYETLSLTNNFPEWTGRVCPAPCEGACVLGINEAPVGIKSIECAIIDHAFREGWVLPRPPTVRTGRRVAIIGSGPAGLAAADQLNHAGHLVTVYDRNDRMGGLLTYGIPAMKLDKANVQRRLDLLAAEGITFRPSTHVGVDVDACQLAAEHDALVLCMGATWPRDLAIPNRQADGIHFAMGKGAGMALVGLALSL